MTARSATRRATSCGSPRPDPGPAERPARPSHLPGATRTPTLSLVAVDRAVSAAQAVLDAERAAERSGVVVRACPPTTSSTRPASSGTPSGRCPRAAPRSPPTSCARCTTPAATSAAPTSTARWSGPASPSSGARKDADGSWHTHLHSHVAAALPGYGDRGIGTALEAAPARLGARAGVRPHRVDVRPAGPA